MKWLLMPAAALTLSSCSGSADETAPAPAPDPTYANAREADAAVPGELRAEYQHLVECEMKVMADSGREPEIDTATVARLTKEVKAGRRADAECRPSGR